MPRLLSTFQSLGTTFRSGNLDLEKKKLFKRKVRQVNFHYLKMYSFIDMKANKNYVIVLKRYMCCTTACFLIELHWNLKVCCLYFFSNLGLPNLWCRLSMGAAYTWTFTVVGSLFSVREFKIKYKQGNHYFSYPHSHNNGL